MNENIGISEKYLSSFLSPSLIFLLSSFPLMLISASFPSTSHFSSFFLSVCPSYLTVFVCFLFSFRLLPCSFSSLSFLPLQPYYFPPFSLAFLSSFRILSPSLVFIPLLHLYLLSSPSSVSEPHRLSYAVLLFRLISPFFHLNPIPCLIFHFPLLIFLNPYINNLLYLP